MGTIKIIKRSHPLSNGLYPICLRITKDRRSKIISLKLSCAENEWNDSKGEFRKTFNNHVQYNRVLSEIKSKVQLIVSEFIANGENFTIEDIATKFLKYKYEKNYKVKDYWENYINMLIKSNRIGHSKYHQETLKSFFSYAEESTCFKDITPNLLNNYEAYLRSRNNTSNGISARMRAIRALYNRAIAEGILSREKYPFDTYKISSLKNGIEKRALSINDIRRIRDLDISKFPHLTDAKFYFLFSYFTAGMNFYDMLKLKWSNIKGDRILYVRSKTKGLISIKILKPVEKIIDFYRKQNRNTDYVFPILLSNDLTAIQIEYRKEKTLKKFNRDLREIAKLCNIEFNITSYVARHSFATNLKQKGIPTDVISEALGHQNISVTQAYLKQLENSVIDNAIDELV